MAGEQSRETAEFRRAAKKFRADRYKLQTERLHELGKAKIKKSQASGPVKSEKLPAKSVFPVVIGEPAFMVAKGAGAAVDEVSNDKLPERNYDRDNLARRIRGELREQSLEQINVKDEFVDPFNSIRNPEFWLFGGKCAGLDKLREVVEDDTIALTSRQLEIVDRLNEQIAQYTPFKKQGRDARDEFEPLVVDWGDLTPTIGEVSEAFGVKPFNDSLLEATGSNLINSRDLVRIADLNNQIPNQPVSGMLRVMIRVPEKGSDTTASDVAETVLQPINLDSRLQRDSTWMCKASLKMTIDFA